MIEVQLAGIVPVPGPGRDLPGARPGNGLPPAGRAPGRGPRCGDGDATGIPTGPPGSGRNPLSSASRSTAGSGDQMATCLPRRVEYCLRSWKLNRLWPNRAREGSTSCTSSDVLRRIRSMIAGTSSSGST